MKPLVPTDSSTRCFIALLLPEAVEDYANQVIRELGNRYQTRTAKAPPHITLQPPFLWSIERLTELEQTLAAFTAGRHPVPIQTNGFSTFAPRVLYINVLKTPELLTLQSNLMQHLSNTHGIVDPKSKSRSFSPHITVASRNLNPGIFKRAWADLQPRDVAFKFESDRLTLLTHDGKQWNVRSMFEFGNP